MDLFATQHGAASDRQLRALGLSWQNVATLIGNGILTRRTSMVVTLAGAKQTFHHRAIVATLAIPRSLLCGASAARLHELDGFDQHDEIEVVRTAPSHAMTVDGVRVRWSRLLTSKDRHVVDSVPVTTVPLTLMMLDSAGRSAEQALDGALRLGHSPLWLEREFRRWQRPRHSSADTMLQLLADRVDRRLPRSWFQRLAAQLFATSGFVMHEEWPIRDAYGGLLAELDLALVEHRVGVECQSWKHHGSPSEQRRDTDRKRILRQLGWEIIEVWWSDLHRMDAVIADLHIAIERAGSRRRQQDRRRSQ